MTSPFRDATLSPAEVRRVLARIAENVDRPMTRAELEAAAMELGLTESTIAQAFDHASDTDDRADEAKGSWFLGGRTRILMERELPCEPTQTQREDLLDEIREAAGDVGTIESLGNTLVWHATPSRNAQSLSVRLRFRKGTTRIVLEERLLGQAIGLFVSLGVGGGIGPMGAYIALITKIGMLGLVAPLIWIPMMLLLARTIFAGMTRRRVRKMHDMMNRIERHAASWQGTRVAVAVASEAEPLEEAADESDDKIKSGRTH